MTHLVILLTFGPLANRAINPLPDNQKLPFSGAEMMGTEDADMGKELFDFGSRQRDEMWRFINAHRHQHKVPVVRRNVCVGITRRFQQDLSMTENCNSENLSTKLADEIHYRWWPRVGHRSIPLTSQAGTGDLTFEALNRNLARKWFPAQSTGTTTTNDASDGTIYSSKPEGTSSEECQGDSDPIPAEEGHPASTGRALNPESPQVRLNHNGSPTSTAESQLLFLARHGETDMNASGKLQGRGVDAQLNGFGDRQATELGRFLRNVPFDTVTSSSLRRAFETAMRVIEENVECAETAQKNGSPDTEKVRKHEGLDELSWGELEGQDSETEPWKGRLENLKGAWNAGHFDRAVEKGESVLEVEARARAAVEACLDNGGSLNLVVSHGRTLRILILSLTGMGLDQMKNIGKVPNTALYVIEVRREAPGMPRSYHLLTPASEETND